MVYTTFIALFSMLIRKRASRIADKSRMDVPRMKRRTIGNTNSRRDQQSNTTKMQAPRTSVSRRVCRYFFFVCCLKPAVAIRTHPLSSPPSRDPPLPLPVFPFSGIRRLLNPSTNPEPQYPPPVSEGMRGQWSNDRGKQQTSTPPPTPFPVPFISHTPPAQGQTPNPVNLFFYGWAMITNVFLPPLHQPPPPPSSLIWHTPPAQCKTPISVFLYGWVKLTNMFLLSLH